jgi:hypothetical protein
VRGREDDDVLRGSSHIVSPGALSGMGVLLEGEESELYTRQPRQNPSVTRPKNPSAIGIIRVDQALEIVVDRTLVSSK